MKLGKEKEPLRVTLLQRLKSPVCYYTAKEMHEALEKEGYCFKRDHVKEELRRLYRMKLIECITEVNPQRFGSYTVINKLRKLWGLKEQPGGKRRK